MPNGKNIFEELDTTEVIESPQPSGNVFEKLDQPQSSENVFEKIDTGSEAPPPAPAQPAQEKPSFLGKIGNAIQYAFDTIRNAGAKEEPKPEDSQYQEKMAKLGEEYEKKYPGSGKTVSKYGVPSSIKQREDGTLDITYERDEKTGTPMFQVEGVTTEGERKPLLGTPEEQEALQQKSRQVLSAQGPGIAENEPDDEQSSDILKGEEQPKQPPQVKPKELTQEEFALAQRNSGGLTVEPVISTPATGGSITEVVDGKPTVTSMPRKGGVSELPQTSIKDLSEAQLQFIELAKRMGFDKPGAIGRLQPYWEALKKEPFFGQIAGGFEAIVKSPREKTMAARALAYGTGAAQMLLGSSFAKHAASPLISGFVVSNATGAELTKPLRDVGVTAGNVIADWANATPKEKEYISGMGGMVTELGSFVLAAKLIHRMPKLSDKIINGNPLTPQEQRIVKQTINTDKFKKDIQIARDELLKQKEVVEKSAEELPAEKPQHDINDLAKKVDEGGRKALTEEEKNSWDLYDVEDRIKAVDAVNKEVPPPIEAPKETVQAPEVPVFSRSEDAMDFGRKNPDKIKDLETARDIAIKKHKEEGKTKDFDELSKQAFEIQLFNEAISSAKNPNKLTPWEEIEQRKTGKEVPKEKGKPKGRPPLYTDAEELGYPILARFGKESITPDWVVDRKTGKIVLADEFNSIPKYFLDLSKKPKSLSEFGESGVKYGGLDTDADAIGMDKSSLLDQLATELDSYHRFKSEVKNREYQQTNEDVEGFIEQKATPDELNFVNKEIDRGKEREANTLISRIEDKGEIAISERNFEEIDKNLAELNSFFEEVSKPKKPVKPKPEKKQLKLIEEQAKYPRAEEGIRSNIPEEKQIAGTMFEKKPESSTGNLFSIASVAVSLTPNSVLPFDDDTNKKIKALAGIAGFGLVFSKVAGLGTGGKEFLNRVETLVRRTGGNASKILREAIKSEDFNKLKPEEQAILKKLVNNDQFNVVEKKLGKILEQKEPVKPVEQVKPAEPIKKVEPPKVPPTPAPKPSGEPGGTKVRGLSKSTEARLIASGITKGIEDLPTYNPRETAPRVEAAANLISSDLERAKRIEFGKEEVPADIKDGGFIHRGLEQYAIQTGDGKLSMELAQSPYMAEKLTEAGQLVQSVRGQDPLSPVAAIKEIMKVREESFEKRTRIAEAQKYETRINELTNKLSLAEEKLKMTAAERSFRKIQREEQYTTRTTKRVIKHAALDAEYDNLVGAFVKASGKMMAGFDPEQTALLIKMTRNRAQKGYTSAAQVVDDIYQALADKVEGINKRDIRDAISGYGKTTERTRSELSIQINDLKRQMQIVSKIEDIEAGKTPITKTKTKVEQSEELANLKEELKSKMKEAGIGQEAGITEEESLARSKAKISKSLAEIQGKIQRGDYIKVERPLTPTDAEKIRLQNELKDVRSKYKKVQEAIGENIKPEEANRIAKLAKSATEAKMKAESSPRRGDNEPATPEEIEWGLKEIEFTHYVESLKKEAGKLTFGQLKAEPLLVTGRVLKDAVNASKALVSAYDNSFIGRQGLKVLFTSDIPDLLTAIPRHVFKIGATNIERYVWGKTFAKSFEIIYKSMQKKPIMTAMLAERISDPMYPLLKKSGVALESVEEAFPTDLLFMNKIPLVGRMYRASENAFTGSAHYIRYKLAKRIFTIARDSGVDMNDRFQTESLGRVVNDLTARGRFGQKKDRTPGIVNAVIWSPKMIAAHVNTLTSWIPYTRQAEYSTYAKKQAAYNLLKIAGGMASIATIANILKPGSAETDPSSSNLGKIKVGNTTYDYSGGIASMVTLSSRIGMALAGKPAVKSNVTGEVTKINTGKYGAATGMDLLYNFLENKTSPPASEAIAHLKGVTRDKEIPTVAKSLKNMYVPFPVKTAQELLNDPNSADFISSMILDGLGISVNTYSTDKDLNHVLRTLMNSRTNKISPTTESSFKTSLDNALEKGVIKQSQYDTYLNQFETLLQQSEEMEEPEKPEENE